MLRGLDYLETRLEVDRKRLSVIGHGAGGLFTPYVAALDHRLRSAACTRTLVAHPAILEGDLYRHRYSGFAPRVLEAFDLPDVTALVAPRPLLILNPVDPLQERVAPEKARLAQLRCVTRTRMTLIMNLLNLAPDIPEEILYLPRTTCGRDPIAERQIRQDQAN